jgi:hypothetical protein
MKKSSQTLAASLPVKPASPAGQRIKSGVKADGLKSNHNETQLAGRTAPRIKAGVKAGGVKINHNETQLAAR